MAKTKKYSRRHVSTNKTASRPKSQQSRVQRAFKWPLLIFVLLCILVLLVGWTFQAVADDPCVTNPAYTHCTTADLHVSAKVPAPALTQPAIITSPADGSHFTDVPITVSGTCPVDSYVNISDNGYFRGTVLCSGSGTFQLQIDIFPGVNQLTAQDYNITDDAGPTGNTITVYYDVPQQPTNPTTPASPAPVPTTSPSPSQPAVAPFEIGTNFKYQGYKVGQVLYWTFTAGGGNTPYAINVDWGDGTNSVISQKDAGNFVASHRYKAAGNGPKNSYIVKVSAADSSGRKTFLQLFVIVNPTWLPNIVASSLPTGPHINNNWLLLAWPAYLVLLLMLASFWLGEREEIINLKKRGILRGRGV